MNGSRRRIAAAIILMAVVGGATACSDDATSSGSGATTTTVAGVTTTAAPIPIGSKLEGDTTNYNIVQIAVSNPAFKTLVRAVLGTGLATTLATGGPFTVFAPTDDAFAKLPPDTLQQLLSANPPAQLSQILQLHVVSGKLTAADLKARAGQSLTTIGGGRLKVEVNGEDVVVGGSKVIIPDVGASNGTIHAIDTVITRANG